MTIADLIEGLKHFPLDARVCLPDGSMVELCSLAGISPYTVVIQEYGTNLLIQSQMDEDSQEVDNQVDNQEGEEGRKDEEEPPLEGDEWKNS